MKDPVTGMRTCLSCGWVHFGVTRQYAEDQVARFNEYFSTLSPEVQQSFYGGHGATLDDYLRCGLCSGSFTNFRDAVEGDCPDGCTIGPIIHEPEASTSGKEGD